MSNFMQKMNFIPQIVFEILKFNLSCNLIGREHYGLQIENQIFSRNAIFTKSERLIMYCNGLTQKSQHKVKFTTDFQIAARQGFQDVS